MARTLEFTLKVNDQASAVISKLLTTIEEKTAALKQSLAAASIGLGADKLTGISTGLEKLNQQIQEVGESLRTLEERFARLQSAKLQSVQPATQAVTAQQTNQQQATQVESFSSVAADIQAFRAEIRKTIDQALAPPKVSITQPAENVQALTPPEQITPDIGQPPEDTQSRLEINPIQAAIDLLAERFQGLAQAFSNQTTGTTPQPPVIEPPPAPGPIQVDLPEVDVETPPELDSIKIAAPEVKVEQAPELEPVTIAPPEVDASPIQSIVGGIAENLQGLVNELAQVPQLDIPTADTPESITIDTPSIEVNAPQVEQPPAFDAVKIAAPQVEVRQPEQPTAEIEQPTLDTSPIQATISLLAERFQGLVRSLLQLPEVKIPEQEAQDITIEAPNVKIDVPDIETDQPAKPEPVTLEAPAVEIGTPKIEVPETPDATIQPPRVEQLPTPEAITIEAPRVEVATPLEITTEIEQPDLDISPIQSAADRFTEEFQELVSSLAQQPEIETPETTIEQPGDLEPVKVEVPEVETPELIEISAPDVKVGAPQVEEPPIPDAVKIETPQIEVEQPEQPTLEAGPIQATINLLTERFQGLVKSLLQIPVAKPTEQAVEEISIDAPNVKVNAPEIETEEPRIPEPVTLETPDVEIKEPEVEVPDTPPPLSIQPPEVERPSPPETITIEAPEVEPPPRPESVKIEAPRVEADTPETPTPIKTELETAPIQSDLDLLAEKFQSLIKSLTQSPDLDVEAPDQKVTIDAPEVETEVPETPDAVTLEAPAVRIEEPKIEQSIKVDESPSEELQVDQLETGPIQAAIDLLTGKFKGLSDASTGSPSPQEESVIPEIDVEGLQQAVDGAASSIDQIQSFDLPEIEAVDIEQAPPLEPVDATGLQESVDSAASALNRVGDIPPPETETARTEPAAVEIQAPEIEVEGLQQAVDSAVTALNQVGDIQSPEVEEIETPEIGEIQPPEIETPTITIPEIEVEGLQQAVDSAVTALNQVGDIQLPGIEVDAPEIEEIQAPEIETPTITIPEIEVEGLQQAVDSAVTALNQVGDIQSPEVEEIETPEIETPTITIPEIEVEGLQQAVDSAVTTLNQVGDIQLPEIEIDVPEIEEIQAPEIETPTITIPEIEVEGLQQAVDSAVTALNQVGDIQSPEVELQAEPLDTIAFQQAIDETASGLKQLDTTLEALPTDIDVPGTIDVAPPEPEVPPATVPDVEPSTELQAAKDQLETALDGASQSLKAFTQKVEPGSTSPTGVTTSSTPEAPPPEATTPEPQQGGTPPEQRQLDLLRVIAALKRDIVSIGNASGEDPELLALQKGQQLLGEAYRYKQQMAAVQGAGFTGEDLAIAQEVANEVNRINELKIQAQGEEGGQGSEQTQKEIARLQESIRYKQQLAEIKVSGFSDEDVEKARALAAQINQVNVERINNSFTETTSLLRVISGLERDIGNFRDASGEDSEVLAKRQDIQLLEEAYRYKQQMADIEGAGLSAEDLATAKEYADEINQINNLLIQAQSENGGEGSAQTQQQVALLQESLRYKRELAEIEDAGFSDEDLAKARQFAAEINAINVDKLQNIGKNVTIGDLKAKFDNAARGAANMIRSIGEMSAGFLAVKFAAQEMFGAVSGFFNGLLDQAIRYKERILSVSATLASTTQVSIGGAVVTDSLKQIQVLKGGVEEAYKELQQRSLKLAGITSDQLNDVFGTVINNISAVGGTMSDAVDLSVKFAAGMTTLGIPLHQQAQEISSILTGQITSDSLLAKKLQVDKQQLETYRAQGKAVEYIQSKLKAVEQGQAILSGMWSGVTSNIQEVFEVIQKDVGMNLLDPILEGMSGFLDFLNNNQKDVTAWAAGVANGFVQFGYAVMAVIEPLIPAITSIGKAFISLFSSAIEGGGGAMTLLMYSFSTIAQVIAVLIVPLQALIDLLGGLASSNVGKFTIMLVAMGVIIQTALIPAFVSLKNYLVAMAVQMATNSAAAAQRMLQSFLDIAATTSQQLAPAISRLVAIMATQLAAAFNQMAVASGGQVKAALLAAAASFTTMATGAATAAGGVTASAAAAAVASGAFSAMGAAIAAAAAPIAIIAGALALAAVAFFNVKQQSNEAQVAIVSGANNTLAVEEKFLKKFQEIQDIRKKGGTLTAEQLRQERALAGQFQDSSENLGRSIAALKEQVNSPLYLGNKDELRKQIEALEKQKQQVDLTPKIDVIPAKKLGDTMKLLGDDLKNTEDAITSQKTSQQQLTAAYEAAGKKIPQAIEAGVATQEDAQRIFSAIMNDERATLDEREKARKAFQKSVEEEAKEQADIYTEQQKAIEISVQTGATTAEEGAKRVADAQIAATNVRIATIKKLLESGAVSPDSPEGRKLLREVKSLEGEKTKITLEGAKKRADAIKAEADLKAQGLDVKKSAIDLDVAKGLKDEEQAATETTKITIEQAQIRLEAVKKARTLVSPNSPEGKKLLIEEQKLQQEITKTQIDAYDKRAEALEKKQKKSLDKATQEELDSQVKLTKLRNAGNLSEEEFSAAKSDAAGKRIKAELALEEEKLRKLQAMQAETPEKEEKLEERIRASRQKTSQFTLQLLENDRAVSQARIAVFEKALNRQVQQIENVSAARKNLADAITGELDRQNRLLEAQKELQDAISAEQKSRFAILKDATKNEAEKKKLAEIEAEFELRTGLQKLEIERQVFEIKQKQAQIAREQAILEQQAAEARAKAELAVAKARPESTPEQIKALELALQAEQLKGENLRKSATLDQSLAVFERQGFESRQNAERNNLELTRANASGSESEKNQRLQVLQKRVNQEFRSEGVDISKLNPSLAAQKSGNSGNFDALLPNLKGIQALSERSPVSDPQPLPSFEETNSLLSGIQDKLNEIAKQGAQVTINNRIERNTNPDEVNKQVFGALDKVFGSAKKGR